MCLTMLQNLEETISSQEDAAASLQGQVAALEKRLAAEVEKQQALEDRRRKMEEKMEEEKQKASQYVKQLEEAKQVCRKRDPDVSERLGKACLCVVILKGQILYEEL